MTEIDFLRSDFNFVNEVTSKENLPDKITIRELTIRQDFDREFILPQKSKLLMAEALDDLGVDGTELTTFHMPGSLDARLRQVTTFIRECKERKLKLQIGFYLHVFGESDEDLKKMIDTTVESGVDELVCIGIGGEVVLNSMHMTHEQMIDSCVKWIKYAKSKGVKVVGGLAYTPLSDFEYLKDGITKLTEAGIDLFHISDSNSTIKPSGMKYLVTEIKKFAKVPLELHCHNSHGLGVANSLAGLEAGAEVVDTFVNGNDPGVAHTPLEELIVALKILYNKETNIRIEKLTNVSRLFEELTGMSIAPNKPIVGEFAFGVTSTKALGTNLKFPLDPRLVGNKKVLKMGHFSGAQEVSEKSRQLGIRIPRNPGKIATMIRARTAKLQRPLTDREFSTIVRSADASRRRAR